MLTVRARLGVWYVSSKPNLCPISVNILLCVLSNHIVPNIIQLNCINTWYIWATFLNNFINFLWILETHDMPRQFRFLSLTNQLHFNLNLAMCKCQCKFLQNNSGHEMLIMILRVFLWETKECNYLVAQNEWVPWKKEEKKWINTQDYRNGKLQLPNINLGFVYIFFHVAKVSNLLSYKEIESNKNHQSYYYLKLKYEGKKSCQ